VTSAVNRGTKRFMPARLISAKGGEQPRPTKRRRRVGCIWVTKRELTCTDHKQEKYGLSAWDRSPETGSMHREVAGPQARVKYFFPEMRNPGKSVGKKSRVNTTVEQ